MTDRGLAVAHTTILRGRCGTPRRSTRHHAGDEQRAAVGPQTDVMTLGKTVLIGIEHPQLGHEDVRVCREHKPKCGMATAQDEIAPGRIGPAVKVLTRRAGSRELRFFSKTLQSYSLGSRTCKI